MPKKTKLKKRGTSKTPDLEAQRRDTARALKAAIRFEKEIQRRAAWLVREIARTNDRMQKLATTLSSHARALEAERDVDASLAK